MVHTPYIPAESVVFRAAPDRGLPHGGVRALLATRVAICGMIQPVATVVAFGWLDETLGTKQLVGGAVVHAAIFLAQTRR